MRTTHTARVTRLLALAAGIAMAAAAFIAPSAAAAPAHDTGFLGSLTHNDMVASTVPGNGDVNPYGVAVVPESRGRLTEGDILVSNFNNAPTQTAPGGQQGTGTTIVEISPRTRQLSVFATIPANTVPGGVGLTTALVVLRSGWVIVGSLPTSDGTSATARSGELFVLDAWGHVRDVITGHGINGPWDATAVDFGRLAVLFVSNVMNGIANGQPATTSNGNVVRLTLFLGDDRPRVLASTVIANDMSVHTDPAALIVGPTGLTFDRFGNLYVADTANSRIASIPGALFRRQAFDAGHDGTVWRGAPLNGPLGLATAPNGRDLLAANGGDNNMIELDPFAHQATATNLDPADPPGGALFGLAVTEHAVYYVNDDDNTLFVLH